MRAYTERLGERVPGLTVRTSDAVRCLIELGLRAADAEASAEPAPLEAAPTMTARAPRQRKQSQPPKVEQP